MGAGDCRAHRRADTPACDLPGSPLRCAPALRFPAPLGGQSKPSTVWPFAAPPQLTLLRLGTSPNHPWFGRSLLNRSSPTCMGGYSGRGRSGRRPARPTRTGGRIRPARAVVASPNSIGGAVRPCTFPSPMTRKLLLDSRVRASRPQVPPQRASRVLARSLLPLVATPPYPLWCG